MRTERAVFAAVTMAAAMTVTAWIPAASAQTGGAPSAPKAPTKTAQAAFDPRDLNGNWYRTSRYQTFSNVNPTNRFIVGGQRPRDQSAGTQEAPFTEKGRAKFELSKPGYGPRASEPANGNDPMGTCDPLGVPRILNAEVGSSHDWWEIVQTPTRFFQYVEWHHDYRIVYTDGRQLPKIDSVDPTWDGFSVGHWDGNTFVVDSMGFDDRTWLDKFGYPHTDQMRLQERYRRVDHDTLELTMTLTDPEFYSRPWESDKKVFKLNAGTIAKPWDEQVYCVPSEEYKFNRLVRDPAGGKKD